MKVISPVKFTLATFAFTWLLLAIAILSGQSSKDFPAILFYIIGGCGPSLVAIFFVWRNFNVKQRREFWSRVFSPRRVQPIWWIIALIAVPAAMLLGVWLNVMLCRNTGKHCGIGHLPRYGIGWGGDDDYPIKAYLGIV